MGSGPIPAVRKIIEHTRLAMTDFAVIELHEAFVS